MRPISPAVNTSPGRTKRGRAGCATTGWRMRICPMPKPNRSGPLTASARSMNTVSVSGSFTWMVAWPLGPIFSRGS